MKVPLISNLPKFLISYPDTNAQVTVYAESSVLSFFSILVLLLTLLFLIFIALTLPSSFRFSPSSFLCHLTFLQLDFLQKISLSPEPRWDTGGCALCFHCLQLIHRGPTYCFCNYSFTDYALKTGCKPLGEKDCTFLIFS